MTFLQTELAAKANEITQLSVKLADQERELNAFKAHDSELKAIVAASTNRMQIGLGGKSTPAGTKPFTAAEVAVGRTKAFTSVSLIKTRARIVEKVIQK
jgi:hypothetical protein